jgi:hypothetical protein
MKGLSMVVAGVAVVSFILAIILKLAHADIITGLTGLTFWRFTIVMLLFAIFMQLHGRETS